MAQACYPSHVTLQNKCMCISTSLRGIKPVTSASLAGELIALMTCALEGALTIDVTRLLRVLQWTVWR